MSTHTDRDLNLDPPTERSPWTQPTFMISAAVVGLLAVLLVILLITSALTGDDEASIEQAEGPVTIEQGSQTSPSVCGLEAVELSGTITQPPAAQWTLVGTVAAPSAEGIGPGEVFDDQFRRCFAHTPKGALFAAANILAVGSNQATSDKATLWFVADGPGRDEAVAKAGTQSSTEPTIRLQIAGFRLLNYTGDTATVDLAVRTAMGSYVSQVYDLVWQDGEWRGRSNPAGTGPLTPPSQIPDLTGYIPWGGA